jgi:hypothetical protein
VSRFIEQVEARRLLTCDVVVQGGGDFVPAPPADELAAFRDVTDLHYVGRGSGSGRYRMLRGKGVELVVDSAAGHETNVALNPSLSLNPTKGSLYVVGRRVTLTAFETETQWSQPCTPMRVLATITGRGRVSRDGRTIVCRWVAHGVPRGRVTDQVIGRGTFRVTRVDAGGA